MEKVSIIIPIYNVEKYIKKCLESLIKQTYKNIEILAISDGTPDKSMKIVEQFAKHDCRIKPIYKDNGGYGSVLEYAIKIIESKYFIICDPDDWLTNDSIEKLVNIAEQKSVDIVVGDIYLVYQNEKNLKYRKSATKEYPVEPQKKYTKENLNNFIYMHASPHAKLYKTEKAKNIQFPHKVNYTDNILYLVYLNKINSAYYLDEALAYYFFDRPGNTMNDYNNKNYSINTFNAIMTVYESIYNQIKSNCNINIIYRLYSELLGLIKKINKIKSKKEQKEAEKRLKIMINEIKKYKPELKKLIKSNSRIKIILKKILMDLIFNDVVYNLTFNLYKNMVK